MLDSSSKYKVFFCTEIQSSSIFHVCQDFILPNLCPKPQVHQQVDWRQPMDTNDLLGSSRKIVDFANELHLE